jgi:hypothetical protein
MQTHQIPRHFVSPPAAPVPATDPGDPGMPQERAARVAARRAFVDLKLTYLEALNSLGEAVPADWLRLQVTHAEDPVDLWLLRAPMFAALSGLQPERRRQRQALRRALETLFPEGEADPGHSAFATLY